MLMKRINLLLTMMVLVLFTSATFAQGVVRGVVQDVNSDETLIGATVIIEGTTIGVTTNLDGSFLLIVPSGDHKLAIRFVGYETEVVDISIKDGSTYNVGTVLMKSSAVGLQEINVFANVAIDRKTPVAVSTLNAAEITEKLGSRELPEVLNETPSVYAVKQGGGFGDSRINIRGFDQRNIAIMVNGIPVNDMENGWVYWSNWAGLGDALQTMQVQRGLGASKLAINSVGGTMNMITRQTDVNAGGSFQAEMTDYGNKKVTLSLSTGKTKKGWAVSFAGSRTEGPGYIDQTWVDAWSYFVSISKEWKNHLFTFTAVGAPQKHGQRSYTVSEKNFEKYGAKYNQHWGTYDGNVLMERENYYHKPQLALNWYWNINEKSFLATSVYASFGSGYGTGTLDNRYDIPPRYHIGRTNNGQIDWDGVANENATHTDTAHFANGNYAAGGNLFAANGDTIEEGGVQLSKNILRESVNEHTWWGIISTFNHTFKNKSTLIAGIDGRTYVGRHYRRVRNLMGGDYWFEGYGLAVDGVAGRDQLKNVGDKIAYDNDGIVRYGGAFAQWEITKGNLSFFAAGTISNTWYGKVDRYNYVNTDQQTADFVNALGYNAKAGLNYNLNEKNNLYMNLGYYSRAPYWDFVFTNYNKNSLVPVNDIMNEKIMGIEIGYGLREKWMALNVNLYYTDWADKSYTDRFQNAAGDDFTAPVTGLRATHMGVEVDAKFKATPWLDFFVVLGLGDWKWKNDVSAVIFDDNGAVVDTVNVYAKDVAVGGQPQTQIVVGTKFQPIKRWYIGASYRYYDRINRDYDVIELDNPGYEPELLPAYGMLDLNTSYQFKIAGLTSYAGMSIYNAIDDVVKTQGDQYGYFWSYGRTFNFSLKVTF